MKKIGFIVLGMLLTFGAMAQGEKNFIDQNYIEVKGVAEMEIVPDEIYLNIHLDEKDTKTKETIEQLEKQLFAALKKAGVDLEKQLSVSDFTGNLRNHFIKGADMQKSKDFELLVNNSKTLGKVFAELDKIKVSNISILRVDHSKIDQFRREVKVNAIKAGKEKAQALAEAVGQNIGRAIYINEGSTYYGNQFANTQVKIRGAAMMEAADMPDLDFQKIKLEYSVQLRFELK